MNKLRIISFCVIATALTILLFSCKGHGKKDNSASDTTKTHATDSTVKTAVPGSLDDAKQHVAKFMVKGADYAALTENLKPTLEDAKALFKKEADAKKAFDYISKAYAQIEKSKDFIRPTSIQTDYIVVSATQSEIKDGKVNVKDFGGFKLIASRLADNVTFYIFKFVKKGAKEGLNHYGLTYVNNHWVIFLKVWKAFR
ncbi:MAG: hypothetical protein ABR968_09665 [Bacteroidales bacterium]|jgi:hypothetical protein